MRLAVLLGLSAITVGCGSTHKTYVTIPERARETDIVGAYDVLHRLGLRVALSRAAAISALDEPRAAVAPSVGTRVAVGSTVELFPTAGPLGSPSVLESHPHYRVPDFTGRTAAAAIAWAGSHGMFWSVPLLPVLPASDAPHLFDAYRVVAQQPKPGGTIVQGVMVGRGFRPTPLTLTVEPASSVPRWLPAAERVALERVFGGATPTRTDTIFYARKIAVVFEFTKVVICGTCGGPSDASIPRGRIVRVGFDRRTHRLTGSLQFCESLGAQPPRALCLRR